jgi:HK97 family phage prohead protease
MTDILRKQYNFEVKQLEGRVLRFTGSTESEDRDGEVIKVAGWQLENYKKNPVFMWAHDYSQPPIGKAVNVHKRNGALLFDVEFADKDTYEFADTIYKLYQGGFLHATSVGFIPDSQFITEGDGSKSPRRTYAKQELLELSAVPVPSNPEALRNAADKLGISIKAITQVFGRKSEPVFDDIAEPPISEVAEDVIVATTTNSTDDTVTVTEHVATEEIIINSPRVHSQQEITDELDYIRTLAKENGLSDENRKLLSDIAQEIARTPASDMAANDIVLDIKPEVKGNQAIDNERINRIINQTVSHFRR